MRPARRETPSLSEAGPTLTTKIWTATSPTNITPKTQHKYKLHLLKIDAWNLNITKCEIKIIIKLLYKLYENSFEIHRVSWKSPLVQNFMKSKRTIFWYFSFCTKILWSKSFVFENKTISVLVLRYLCLFMGDLLHTF